MQVQCRLWDLLNYYFYFDLGEFNSWYLFRLTRSKSALRTLRTLLATLTMSKNVTVCIAKSLEAGRQGRRQVPQPVPENQHSWLTSVVSNWSKSWSSAGYLSPPSPGHPLIAHCLTWLWLFTGLINVPLEVQQSRALGKWEWIWQLERPKWNRIHKSWWICRFHWQPQAQTKQIKWALIFNHTFRCNQFVYSVKGDVQVESQDSMPSSVFCNSPCHLLCESSLILPGGTDQVIFCFHIHFVSALTLALVMMKCNYKLTLLTLPVEFEARYHIYSFSKH